ncbi:hypothetical protein SAMN05216464_10648 [Mucilaginibacter pineti]|uniref:Erythromycin esterase homolog n=1 Tax=Mucilaginibacter pineti TaxID=1391627 RepID=A0A1G7CQ92_9SPHI|nr:hypothetical protein [Mucilaginibacter pineti]SDE41393.1 hypothetical protein SAMN05216464_10648 [Mucilaginibacter pineti]
MKHLLLVLYFLIFSNLLIAQTPAQNSFKTAMEIMDKQPENYLAPLKAIRKIKVDTAEKGGLNIWLQAMMTYYSFLEDYPQLLFYSDFRFKDQINTEKVVYDTAFVRQHTFVDASDYITARANLSQVTMINEAHHLPYHRAFMLSMLKRFYDCGYRYLAIEALEDSLINSKKYPDYNTGYYIHEPLFGELLRQAKKIGFIMIPYDPQEDCNQESEDPNYCNRFRDSLMALNLVRILNKEPKAKLLVYAGYDHIHKGSSNSWKKMAQYFKEFSGIDPFTVDLTQQVEHLYPQLEEKEFISVNKFRNIQQPVIALQGNNAWHGKYVDATVIFPIYNIKNTRSTFLSIAGLRKPYKLNNYKLKRNQLVQAFYSNEIQGNRIPADQLLIKNGNNVLFLFKGKYVLDIKNSEGILLKRRNIIIN